MSDPFDRLRASGPGPGPDVDAIKARARHIERTRYQRLGGVAVATIMLAVVGIALTTTGPDDSARRLSVGEIETPPASTPSERREDARSGALEESPAAGVSGFVGTTTSPGVAPGGAATSSGDRAATAPSSESAASSRAADEAPSAFRVTLEVTAIGVGRGAHFTLDVCNTTDQPRKLTFPTGQRYDFEVRRDGNLVWRWSDGRAFTQVYGEETWRPGECKTYDDAWNGRESDGDIAPPGRYSAIGIVASSPQLRSAPKSFCLDAC